MKPSFSFGFPIETPMGGYHHHGNPWDLRKAAQNFGMFACRCPEELSQMPDHSVPSWQPQCFEQMYPPNRLHTELLHYILSNFPCESQSSCTVLGPGVNAYDSPAATGADHSCRRGTRCGRRTLLQWLRWHCCGSLAKPRLIMPPKNRDMTNQ